jgi:crotonobetainyl-CoA:carnitine CoA-transferase CaiB-like acyl-CoA transferase
MGWTLTTTMWRDQDPITGARINGTPERPGIAASFNDIDGKPLVFQLMPKDWKPAMKALNFQSTLDARGLSELGPALESEEYKNRMLATLAELLAKGKRADWVERLRGFDIVAAPINTLLESSNDEDVLANGYVTEVEYPDIGETLKVHGSPWQFSETPANVGVAPKLGEHTDTILTSIGYSESEIASLAERKII